MTRATMQRRSTDPFPASWQGRLDLLAHFAAIPPTGDVSNWPQFRPTMRWASEELDRLSTALQTAQEALARYGQHERQCVLAYFEAGEPTAKGGYRVKYRGEWYPAKPLNQLPPCTCGLTAALAALESWR